MKRLLPAALFLVLPGLALPGHALAAPPAALPAAPATPTSPVVAAFVNARLREPIVNGDTNAARAAMLADAEKICAALQASLNLACAVNNIQFNAGPMMRGPYGMQQPAGQFLIGNANLQLRPQGQ